jgi:hypothetical protein
VLYTNTIIPEEVTASSSIDTISTSDTSSSEAASVGKDFEKANLYYVPPPPQKNSPSRGKLSDKYRNYLKKIRSIRPINDTLEDGIIVKNAGKFEVNLKDKQYFS